MSMCIRRCVVLLIAALYFASFATGSRAEELPNINLGKTYMSSQLPTPEYSDAGGKELTDGITGTNDLLDTAWSGYNSTNLEFTFDLQTDNFIAGISMNFLSEPESAVRLPSEIGLYVSEDGANFIHYGKQTSGNLQSGDSNTGVYRFDHQFLNANNVRFVKIVISGSPDAWLFIDEIKVLGFESPNINAPMQQAQTTEVSFSALLTERLDVDDLIDKAKSAGAGSVSLYVGYSGILWFDSTALQNRYGLLEHDDTGRLSRAIEKLHKSGIKVIAVLSSQLWGENPGNDGSPMLQNNGLNTADLFDPLKSQNFFVEIVDLLMNYDVDGIYVGEPYYKDSTYGTNDPARNERFYDFYWALARKIKQRNPKAIHQMLLPNHMWFSQYFNFGAGMRDHGIPDKIKDINFDYIGLDISTVYEWKNWEQELGRYKALLALTNRLAAGKKSIAQISIVRFGSQVTLIPKEAVLDQISWAKKYGINKLQVFDYQYLDLYNESERDEIMSALKNINDGIVENGPRQIKLLSTENAFQVADWQKYIEEQINAAGQMASSSLLKIALDEDLFPQPPSPWINGAYFKDGFLTVNWGTYASYRTNLEVSLDQGNTWKEILFFSNPGQTNHTEFIGGSNSTPLVRVRVFDGNNYSNYTYRMAITAYSYLYINAPKIIAYGQTSSVFGFIWASSPTYTSDNGINNLTVIPKYKYGGNVWVSLAGIRSYQYGSYKGFFNFVHKPRHNVDYKAIFNGNADFLPANSMNKRTIVKAGIGLAGEKRQSYYLAYGKVSPDKAKSYVSIQVKRNTGRWRTVRKILLDVNSKYRHKYYFKEKGSYQIRAYFAGDGLNYENYSSIKKFSVR